MELDEQTLEQILVRQREEFQHFNLEQREVYQRYLGAAMEEFTSQVKQVAEGQDLLREQIGTRLVEIEKKQDAMREDLGEAIQKVAQTLNVVQQDVESMKVDIDILKADMSIIRSELKQKVGRDELAVLEARVSKLEMSHRSGRV